MASQAIKVPRVRHASVPPAIAASTTPDRTKNAAIPMACAEDAQALDVTKHGPFSPKAIDTKLADPLIIARATVSG
jgi:hypothetical protein